MNTSTNGQTNGSPKSKVKVAILGSGYIGRDLMFKILRDPGHMGLVLLTGIDPKSEGLARARSLGINGSDEGIRPNSGRVHENAAGSSGRPVRVFADHPTGLDCGIFLSGRAGPSVRESYQATEWRNYAEELARRVSL